MKQKDRNKKLSGAEGFEAYYSNLFDGRWQSIKESFSLEPDYAEWKAGGEKPYFLDSASVRAAVSLPLENAMDILDLCAAPGGKTLVLASNMNSEANLLSNERSPERKNRLANTVRDCLPPEIQERVTVICKDGAQMCLKNEEKFDAILLDAPCSSERHVLADPKYLSEWSPSRIKTLSMAQWALLSSAWRMLRPEGYLLYSTCALSPDENDNVVAKLLKKFDNAKLCEPKISLNYKNFTQSELPEYEKTEFGAHVLPDKAGGAGPLYFCLLQKIPANH
ncbi:MAG: RsmB/NOP family class I SAM-dependent RNA methyltransferase [Treponema sp.]|uniref:SAM-dependent methyltransferase n=1 Tax=Treponema sp. TaxID=166 RepID=UPI0025D6C2EC|nr:SAM-dependent methyltransferase [Treponema sp.]MBR0495379.1 RsmB/NOP family class I SAM-dependent RNA methyltransferase [Treponema sp.]